MNESTPILPDSANNKREQIIKLLSEGNHSAKNIAKRFKMVVRRLI
jgi:hypothetical protein